MISVRKQVVRRQVRTEMMHKVRLVRSGAQSGVGAHQKVRTRKEWRRGLPISYRLIIFSSYISMH
jgi:hypothetical protein